jgi:hypothetical protein
MSRLMVVVTVWINEIVVADQITPIDEVENCSENSKSQERYSIDNECGIVVVDNEAGICTIAANVVVDGLNVVG